MRRTSLDMHRADAIAALLKERGYRITTARAAIIRLLSRPRTSLSIEDIIAALPTVDYTTVYRTVSMLAYEQLIARVHDSREPVRYELSDHHHDHIVCTTCGATEHIPCVIPRTRRRFRKSSFKKVTGHELTLFGLCNTCA